MSLIDFLIGSIAKSFIFQPFVYYYNWLMVLSPCHKNLRTVGPAGKKRSKIHKHKKPAEIVEAILQLSKIHSLTFGGNWTD